LKSKAGAATDLETGVPSVGYPATESGEGGGGL